MSEEIEKYEHKIKKLEYRVKELETYLDCRIGELENGEIPQLKQRIRKLEEINDD